MLSLPRHVCGARAPCVDCACGRPIVAVPHALARRLRASAGHGRAVAARLPPLPSRFPDVRRPPVINTRRYLQMSYLISLALYHRLKYSE